MKRGFQKANAVLSIVGGTMTLVGGAIVLAAGVVSLTGLQLSNKK